MCIYLQSICLQSAVLEEHGNFYFGGGGGISNDEKGSDGDREQVGKDGRVGFTGGC